MNIIIFLIILIVLFAIYYIHENIKNQYIDLATNLSYWKNKYNDNHNKLIDLINDILPYFKKYNIQYWVHAGTLLGYTRHKGFIPWDDDIDFGYIDDTNIKDFKKELQDKYIIEDTFFGFKIINKKNNNIFIDMFKYVLDHNNNTANQTFFSNLIWPKENYNLDELLPLKKGQFENLELNVPKESEKICMQIYGDDYKDIYYIHMPHYDNFLSNIYDGIGISSVSGKKFYIKDLHW